MLVEYCWIAQGLIGLDKDLHENASNFMCYISLAKVQNLKPQSTVNYELISEFGRIRFLVEN